MPKTARKTPAAIETLCNEHRYIHLLLKTMSERLRDDGLNSASDFYLILDIARYLHEYTDVVHHPTEDILFERLVKRDPSSKPDLERLKQEHKKLEASTAEIRDLVRTAAKVRTRPASAAAHRAIERYAHKLEKHMRIEEELLFPRLIECLANSDWEFARTRMVDVDDPLFGGAVDRKYQPLFEFFSSRSTDVSRKLTKLSFPQFDSLIISADAAERGIGDMWALVCNCAAAVATETQIAARAIADDPKPGPLVRSQSRYMKFLASQALTFGKDAAGIYITAVRDVVLPFFTDQSAHRNNRSS